MADGRIPAATAALPRGRRARAWGWVGRMLRIFGIVYGVLCGFLYFAQSWLIFPGRDTQGSKAAEVSPQPGLERLDLTTADGDRVAAVFGAALTPEGAPRPDAAARPTVLYFYGNAMTLRDSLERGEEFRRHGVNVLIPEYVGYGMSGGRAGEAGCYATAEAAWRHLLARKDVDPRRIVAAGWSLGAAVAVDLAAHHPEIAGLATFSAFTSMTDIARREHPFVPVSLLLRHRFESERKMAEVTCPVFLAHGTDDELIPFAMMERLARAARGTVTRTPVAHGDHNGVFVAGGEDLRQAFGAWLAAR